MQAFLIGLAVSALCTMMYYVLELFPRFSNVSGALIFLGPFVGAGITAIFSARDKFTLGVLLSIPASLLMSAGGAIARWFGVVPDNHFQGIYGLIFVAAMNLQFVSVICATGAALGCIVTYKPRIKT